MVDEHLWLALLVGTLLALLTVVLHGAGFFALTQLLKGETAEEHHLHIGPLSLRGALTTLALVIGLFVLHGVEIWIYALTYVALGAIPDFSTALYFSTITYAAIGYDSDPLDPAWRMVAGIEGINGLILLGWSTAFFVTVMGRVRRM